MDTQISEASSEMQVQLAELQKKLQEGVQNGTILPQRMELQLQKAVQNNEAQLANMSQKLMAEAKKEMSVIENKIVTAEE